MDEATRKVRARLHELGVEPEITEFATGVPTAAVAAERVGCEVGAIANSLVFRCGDEPLLIVSSGAARVNTDRVAKELELPRIRRADPEYVHAATGQRVGGVAPVGHPSPLRTVVDLALRDHPTVWASAGSEQTLFGTTYDELVHVTGGTPCEVR